MLTRFLVIFIVTLALTSCDSSQVDTVEEEQAVRSTWDALNQAFLDKDWPRYLSFFDQRADFQMVHPAQRDWISGSEEFQSRYEPIVTAEGEWRFETSRFELNIGPGARVAWAMIEFTFAPENGDPITNWELVVFRKSNEKWRVASAMAATLPSS